MEPTRMPQRTVDELIGESPPMRELRRQVARLAQCDVSLLLQGESGTGKELVARTVHRQSLRADGPFMGVNCAAIHESLLESELFGHDAGAFTGARQATLGFLRAANGGTILLDEVGDMGEQLQSKLLRVLEERTVVPVGSTRAEPINVRVIAATHCDLAQDVKDGRFRQDLYYRLNVVSLWIPPLRRRRSDIPLLTEHLLARTADVLSLQKKTISNQAMAALMAHNWPGNVRELGNVVQRAYVLGKGQVIDVDDLPPDITGGSDAPARPFPTLKDVTRIHVERALDMSGGVKTAAAAMLGIDRKSLWRMMRRYDYA